MNKKPLTLSLLILMIALGTADAFLIEKGKHLSKLPSPQQFVDGELIDNQGAETGGQEGETDKPTQGVRKNKGPNVLEVLVQQQFTFKEGDERILLRKIVPEQEATVEARILLKDGDRAGAIAWIDSPNVKRYFLVLKEALHATFTPAVKDLVDETQRREGKPTRNILTFMDTGILDERIIFVRVRERLYELHIPEDKDVAIYELIDVLTN